MENIFIYYLFIIILKINFQTGSSIGPKLVEGHGVNNRNKITTSRFEMKSQFEPVMPDIDIDLGQPKVKG